MAATGRRVRRAWLAGGSAFAVAALAYGVFSGVGAVAHQTERAHSVVTVPVGALDVDGASGSVHVIGTTGGPVTIDTRISNGLFSPTRHQSVEGDRLVLSSGCPTFNGFFCGVDYTIHVPEDVAVRVRSRGGTITVDNVNGDLDLSSSGGRVHVTGGRGSQRLNSSGGGVSAIGISAATVNASSSGGGVHLAFQQPPANVNAGSSGGGIRIDLPNTPDAYRINASSSGGGVHTPVRTDPSSSRVIHASSSGGGVTVQYSTS
jgi:hypothetical protein